MAAVQMRVLAARTLRPRYCGDLIGMIGDGIVSLFVV